MTDVPPESRPVPPEPDPDPTATRVLPPDREPGPPKQRFVDRVWDLRAMIAVALASVILGGLGGAALASVGDHDDRRRGPGQFHRGGPMMPPGSQQWQWRDGPGRGNGNDPMPRWRGPGEFGQQGPGGPPSGPPRTLPPLPTPEG